MWANVHNPKLSHGGGYSGGGMGRKGNTLSQAAQASRPVAAPPVAPGLPEGAMHLGGALQRSASEPAPHPKRAPPPSAVAPVRVKDEAEVRDRNLPWAPGPGRIRSEGTASPPLLASPARAPAR